MAAFILALVESLWAIQFLFTIDGCKNAFAVSALMGYPIPVERDDSDIAFAVFALMLFEAQRNKISRAGREGLEKRGRFTASAAAHYRYSALLSVILNTAGR